MHPPSLLPYLLLPLLPLTTPSPSPQTPLSPSPLHIFANPPPTSPLAIHLPTAHDSAILARRILHLSSIGTLSTVFPPAAPAQLESRPPQLGGAPIGLMDYFAACAPAPHDPTLLAIAIATSFQNAAAGSNVSLSLRWHPPPDAPPPRDAYTYSPANMPRVSLLGRVRAVEEEEGEGEGVRECFLGRHPDAEAWVPGNRIHESYWARLVVEQVYWIGGFGDRAYIGWIPVGEWRGVTEEEVRGARLVGEKGWEGGRVGRGVGAF
ncbi:hypothetical protein MMC11_007626 [Xylographa trunciseda]|nr:hypothetical protein [Xylographa trunciseda]